MGEFIVRLNGRPISVRNMTHAEGFLALWRAGFEGGAAPTWRMGICGVDVPNDPEQRPDHTSDTPQRLFWIGREWGTRYEDVTRRRFKDGLSHALDGGALDLYGDGAHRALMAYEEKAVGVSVSDEEPCSIATSGEATWVHGWQWAPPDDPLTGAPGTWMPDGPPWHGWPWQTPVWPLGSLRPLYAGRLLWTADDRFVIGRIPVGYRAGCFVYVDGTEGRAAGFARAAGGYEVTVSGCSPDRRQTPWRWTSLRCSMTVREIERNPWMGLSGPVDMVWIATGEPPKLVASSRFARPVRLVPGGGLTASYRWCLSSASMTTAMTRALVRRVWTGAQSAGWSDWRFGLGGRPAGELNRRSSLADVGELTSAEATGYARSAATGWTVGADGAARLGAARPCFTNSGAQAWPRVLNLFAVARFGGGEPELAAWWPIDETLGAGDSLSLDGDAAVVRMAEGSDE